MAAPIHYVTRRAELPAGAHAMFTAGHGYYAGPAPGAVLPPPPKPAPKRKSQSVSQVANQQVNQQLAPVLAGQDAQAKQQNDAIQSFALALLGKLQPVAGQIGGDYDKAIGQTAQLSGAAANALRNANPNQQDQQMLQAVGAPQEQRAQVASQLADTFGGGAAVTLFNQGQVPGTQLATDKASAQAQAGQLPGLAALKGQQDLASALSSQRTARQQTLAQRPGLVQSATQAIKGNIANRDAAAYDKYKFETARGDALAASGQKAQAAAVKDAASLDYKYAALKERATVDQTRSAQADQRTRITFAKTWGYDPVTGKIAPGFKMNAGGHVVKAAAAGKGPHLTGKQIQDYKGSAATLAEQAHNGFTDDKGVAHPSLTYKQALLEADKAGIPRPIALQYLNRWYPAATPPKTFGPSKRKGDLGVQASTPGLPGQRG